MDDHLLRALLAGALAPLVWGPIYYLLDRRAAKNAARDAARREQKLKRAHNFGRRLAHRLRSLWR